MVAHLRAVLEASTEFIPGFRVSRLDVVEGDHPDGPDLMWVNEFEDESAFWLYAAHPYHTSVINDLLSFESPNTVIGKRSKPVTWSDDPMVDASAIGSVGSAVDLSPVDSALGKWGGEVPAVYLVEQINVVPGGSAAYVEAMRTTYLPLTLRHGMRLVASFESPAETGEDHLVFVWQMDGWAGAFRSFAGMLSEVDELPRWLDLVAPLRRGGWRRYLLPTELPGNGEGARGLGDLRT